MKLQIDPEFSELIPPLSDEERVGLEADIGENGCRDALVVWQDGHKLPTLLDGHNRYAICQKHGLPFKTHAVELADRDAAMDWIDRNQLNRRNLKPDVARVIRGRMHARAEKRQGSRSDLTSCQTVRKSEVAEEIAKRTGVSTRTVYRDAKAYAAVERMKQSNPEAAKAVLSGQKRLREVERQERKEETKKAADLPSAKYRVLYADPPWKYGDQLTEAYGATKYHYKTMTIRELCDLKVSDLAEKNAVLFLWVTSPLLAECWAVIEAWGFDYKASFVWDKVKHNMGHYNSVRHEFLLICTRGSCLPDSNKLIDSVQSIERSAKHSEKPEEFRKIIDGLYPHGRRVELFARCEAKGWDRWGDQA